MGMAQRPGYRGAELSAEKRFRNILTLSQGVGFETDHEYLAGMSRAAVPLNWSLIFHHYRPEECANVLKPEFQPRALFSGHIDGIVLIPRWLAEITRSLRERYPVASIIHEYPGTDLDVIALDDRGGMDLLVDHLVRTGGKRIGFSGLCGDTTWSRARFAAFADATIQHRHELRMKDVVEVPLAEARAEREFEGGAALVRAARMTAPGVDFWICPSEMIARWLLSHFSASGFKIPPDHPSPLPSPHRLNNAEATLIPLCSCRDSPRGIFPVNAPRSKRHRSARNARDARRPLCGNSPRLV